MNSDFFSFVVSLQNCAILLQETFRNYQNLTLSNLEKQHYWLDKSVSRVPLCIGHYHLWITWICTYTVTAPVSKKCKALFSKWHVLKSNFGIFTCLRNANRNSLQFKLAGKDTNKLKSMKLSKKIFLINQRNHWMNFLID